MTTKELSLSEAASSGPRTWYMIKVTVTRWAEEAIEYGLMEAGALGTETTDESEGAISVAGYFDSPPQLKHVEDEIAGALRIYSLPESSVRSMSLCDVPVRDWLGEWKRNWRPVEIGEHFLIAPPWTRIDGIEGDKCGERIVIRIEPGMAFGTGTHETTRLCLAAIERYFQNGSFLDVGTGTGILAIAAAKLSPEARIEALDIDPEAIAIAQENAFLNNVAERIEFGAGTVEATTRSADCVCANLTADVIVEILPALLAVSCGRLILSGILGEQVESVGARLNGLGAHVFEVVPEGEWVAIIV